VSTLNALVELFLADHVQVKRKPATADHYRHDLRKWVLLVCGPQLDGSEQAFALMWWICRACWLGDKALNSDRLA
jgi:hypothetical protein